MGPDYKATPSLSRRAIAQLGAAVVVAQALAGVAIAGASPDKAGKPVKIVAFGDSLTAGFGLSETAAFPAVLEKRLRTMGYDVTVINAGVSGDTTAGGLARLDWSLGEGADLVLVELGANDMLRGLPPAAARRNLQTILERLKARGVPVALSGMRALANWGEAYRAEFEAIHPALAAAYDAPLYPFFLDGVTGVAGMTLPDGLHPSAAGVERIVDGYAPFLARVLDVRVPRAKP